MIEVSHDPTLLSFGMGLATIDGEGNPGFASSVFVLQAARDCALRVQHIFWQQDVGPDNPNLSFYGDVIGAGMAEYWESGCKCHGYHELFLNGLLLVLYGGIRNCAVGILDSAKAFWAYHIQRAFITDLTKLEVMSIESGITDEISYATFPGKRNTDKTQNKSSKKHRKLERAPSKLFKIIQLFSNAGLGGVLSNISSHIYIYPTYSTYLGIWEYFVPAYYQISSTNGHTSLVATQWGLLTLLY